MPWGKGRRGLLHSLIVTLRIGLAPIVGDGFSQSSIPWALQPLEIPTENVITNLANYGNTTVLRFRSHGLSLLNKVKLNREILLLRPVFGQVELGEPPFFAGD